MIDVDYQCRLKYGYAGASAGKTKLEILAAETLDSWIQQAVKGEMADAAEFLAIIAAHIEKYRSKF